MPHIKAQKILARNENQTCAHAGLKSRCGSTTFTAVLYKCLLGKSMLTSVSEKSFVWSIWVMYGSMWSVMFVSLVSQLASWEPSCVANTLTLDLICTLFNQIISYQTCLYSFIPFSLTVIMGWGHKVSLKQYGLASFCSFHFKRSEWNLV